MTSGMPRGHAVKKVIDSLDMETYKVVLRKRLIERNSLIVS